MKQDTQNSMKLVIVNVNQVQVFVIIKQRWNKGKWRCECKELIDKGIYDKIFVWNPCNCNCECDKSCDAEEYLDYENFKCIKRLTDKLVEECSGKLMKIK